MHSVISLEEGMATLSSILAWRIPWSEEPGRLQSMGSQRVGHDGATNTHIHLTVTRWCEAGSRASVLLWEAEEMGQVDTDDPLWRSQKGKDERFDGE